MTDTSSLISSHHIGGRDGSGTLDVPTLFEDDIHRVLYDADADCIEQITESNRDVRLEVLPLCVGRNCGEQVLNIYYDPFLSSLLEMNPEYADMTLFMIDPRKGPIDYKFADTGRTMERRNVDVVTLDSLYAVNSPITQSPDFLSLDVQGAEYEVLEGGLKTLETSVLALRLEVEFHELYKDQKLFGDISQFLANRGFHFARFIRMSEVAPSRQPIGLGSGGFHVYSEALFLRKVDHITNVEDLPKRITMLLKLGFIAISFGQFEYSLSCLRKAWEVPIPDDLERELAARNYYRFLCDLKAAVARHPSRYTPLFSQRYSFAESKGRFDPGVENCTAVEGNLTKIAATLRRDVTQRGGRRVCVMPFGLLAREMSLTAVSDGDVPLVFFDNNFAFHREQGHAVHSPEELTEDDYVVILSDQHSDELERQVIQLRGYQPERVLGYQAIKKGRWCFEFERTEVESVLNQNGFENLSDAVRERRVTQGTAPRYDADRMRTAYPATAGS